MVYTIYHTPIYSTPYSYTYTIVVITILTPSATSYTLMN